MNQLTIEQKLELLKAILSTVKNDVNGIFVEPSYIRDLYITCLESIEKPAV